MKIKNMTGPLRWIFFCAYLLFLFFGLKAHELWGDELHSWNIARNSGNFFQVFANARYEGHPPLWYFVMRLVSYFCNSPQIIKFIQFTCAATIAFLLLFRLYLPLMFSVMILCGYYFAFEYAVLSRNYAIAILPAFIICMLRQSQNKNKGRTYLLLLLLLSLSHLLGIFLALSIHLSIGNSFSPGSRKQQLTYFISGLLLLVPACCFIIPPGDSVLGFDFWKKIWTSDQYTVSGQAVIRAFGPLPLWKETHLWNTNYFIDQMRGVENLKLKSWLISAGLVLFASVSLFQSKAALKLFLFNVALTWIFAIFFPLSNARYVGFIFVGYIVALCILFADQRPQIFSQLIIGVILVIQLPGAFIMLKEDRARAFSMSGEVEAVLRAAPEKVITDYWTLNYLSGMTGKEYYCLGYNAPRSYILWNSVIGKVMNDRGSYGEGFALYEKKYKKAVNYLLSNNNLDQIWSKDSNFVKEHEIKLLIEKTGSIDKYSDLHLYSVKIKN